MHGLVIDVGAECSRDVVATVCGLAHLPEMLLFIANEVLCACHDTLTLNALDSRSNQGTGQVRVRTKPFLLLVNIGHCLEDLWRRSTHPVPATFGCSSQGTTDGAQHNVHAFISVLGTQGFSTEPGQVAIPCCGNIQASGKGRDIVGWLPIRASSQRQRVRSTYRI